MAPLLFLLSLACNRAPDPLAEQKKLCTELEASKSLKAGMTVESCAKELKARAGNETPAAADAGQASAQK
ncbi:MAG TPA: hypothetical protein VH083_05195 [Myxococcales bacterium]|nr:hypothetical protein [Myxococcales bacterium]